jgi:hypothetical protein
VPYKRPEVFHEDSPRRPPVLSENKDDCSSLLPNNLNANPGDLLKILYVYWDA